LSKLGFWLQIGRLFYQQHLVTLAVMQNNDGQFGENVQDGTALENLCISFPPVFFLFF
jgi:hypothetical protein